MDSERFSFWCILRAILILCTTICTSFQLCHWDTTYNHYGSRCNVALDVLYLLSIFLVFFFTIDAQGVYFRSKLNKFSRSITIVFIFHSGTFLFTSECRKHYRVIARIESIDIAFHNNIDIALDVIRLSVYIILHFSWKSGNTCLWWNLCKHVLNISKMHVPTYIFVELHFEFLYFYRDHVLGKNASESLVSRSLPLHRISHPNALRVAH